MADDALARGTAARLRTLPRLRAFLAPLAVLALGWFLYDRARPTIERVPAIGGDGKVHLFGHGFGATAGDAELGAGGASNKLAIESWSDDAIVAAAAPQAQLGSVRVRKPILFGSWSSEPVPVVAQAHDLPSNPYGYAVPVEPESPWPLFRRDHRNSGRSPLPARYAGDKPWAFRTGKGIFSTPVIDAGGRIYVGSADHVFYAIDPNGSEAWRFPTGEIIDSAAALPRAEEGEVPSVLVPSGDGHIYRLRTVGSADQPAERILWAFDARAAARAGYNDWFEGNVAIGFDGTLLAGNTNFNYYAISPAGHLDWTYGTDANNWSMAAIDDDGTIIWASNDTRIRAVRPDGHEKWSKRTLGMIAASAALGSDGTAYIGSFDSSLYALDAATGSTRWRFRTGDHVYASAALGADEQGRTTAIYFGSTDGIFYALDPAGKPIWKYDTGDPIRSSPAIGAGAGGAGAIVYFGSGNGKLYALDAATGKRRWSFDSTGDDPEVADRNDLNSSVALGRTGVYIGGEQGLLWYVPYDYCLHAADRRCERSAGEDLPADEAGFFYVTPGGSTLREAPPAIPAASTVTLRLVVRSAGETIDAWLCNTPFLCSDESVSVKTDPPIALRAVRSADGHYLHLLPDGILEPGRTYRVEVEGDYYTGGFHFGNLTLGGTRRGRVKRSLELHTAQAASERFPLATGEDEVGAFEWTRLALPIPPMLPSLNQIGFDYMDWIVGAVDVGAPDANREGRLLLWAIGARRDKDGVLVADPHTDFTLPLSGRYLADSFRIANRDFTMKVTGIPIPFQLFEMRGQLGADGVVRPGATAYSEAKVLSIPTFGPYLALAGLATDLYDKLVVSGTYVTRPYRGPANKRPRGARVESVELVAPGAEPGHVIARIALERGDALPIAQHRPGIVLIDAESGEPVALNYQENLTASADAAGNLREISLALPKGTALPRRLEAAVLVDVFPLGRTALTQQLRPG